MLSRGYRTEADQRKRQIDTLKIFNDNVTEIQEGTEYKVVFTSGNHELILSVYLSGEFPKEPPQIRLSPIIIHPWVTSEGQVTGAPGLLNFTIHSDLGRVVQAIIREFERTPPPLASELVSGAYTSDVDRTSPVLQNFNNTYQNRNIHSPILNSVPNARPAYFQELSKLTLEELQFLNDCEDKQDEFLSNLQSVTEVNNTIDNLISQIEILTDSNLSKQSTLEQKKQELLTKINTVLSLRNKCEYLNQIYQQLSEKYSPNNIKDLLHNEVISSDEESERIAEKFLSGNLSMETFLQLYIEARSSNQTRKTKEEKLSHQLNELKRAGF